MNRCREAAWCLSRMRGGAGREAPGLGQKAAPRFLDTPTPPQLGWVVLPRAVAGRTGISVPL